MRKDERDLLEVLKFELQFLRDGGYGRSPKTPWRPQYIFEDSLTCMNFDSKENPAPCGECVLMYLVPPQDRSRAIPCRHIPMTDSGETLDSLYRYSNQAEIEETAEQWLVKTIATLEEQRRVYRSAQEKRPAFSGEQLRGTPLYQKQHPKCANPACPTAFHWTGGGKFFRFHPEPGEIKEGGPEPDAGGGIHGVRHYWLCERCSHAFTLVYDEGFGVALKLLWPELPTAEEPHEMTAT